MRSGPATVQRSQRRNTGTVNLNFAKIEKKAVVLIANQNVHMEICNSINNMGIAAKASIKKNLGVLEASRQCAAALEAIFVFPFIFQHLYLTF